jgi:integrase/recombinase XerD
MGTISWEKYPRVAGHTLARKLLLLENALQHSLNTIDAYARGREDFFSLCERLNVVPEHATREHVAIWVQELSTRPANCMGSAKSHISDSLLSNATIQQRLTAVRLFYDFLIQSGIRSDNPVGRGRYTPGKAFGGSRERGLVKRQYKLPWIPNDEQWMAILNAVRLEPIRNRVMFAVAYDAPCAAKRFACLRSPILTSVTDC